MEKRLGYCCINLSLSGKKISVNNSCVKRTWLQKGLPHVSALALKNVRNLVEIIKWNDQNDIKVYRMSSFLLYFYILLLFYYLYEYIK
jgi:UV DNA damage endonuclease